MTKTEVYITGINGYLPEFGSIVDNADETIPKNKYKENKSTILIKYRLYYTATVKSMLKEGKVDTNMMI